MEVPIGDPPRRSLSFTDREETVNRPSPSVHGLRRPRRAGLAALTAILALTLASAAFAAIRLVPSYGSKGIATVGSGAVLGVATHGSGPAIAVGYSGKGMLVERLGRNGTRGARRFGAGRGVANAVLVQPDGKILVAGTTAPVSKTMGDNTATAKNGDMVLKRFNANGSPDRKFGSGGTAHIGGAIAYGLALGKGGTIVVAGFLRGSDTTPRVAIARLTAKGKADRSFGKSGLAEVDLGPFSEANAVAVQRDGKIVFAGDERPDFRITNAVVGRLSKRGSLDRSYGHGGVYTYFHPRGGADSSFRSIALDSAGRAVVAGADFQNAGQALLVARLNGRGSPDNGFGSHGITTALATVDFTGGDLVAGAKAVAIAARGEIIAAGQYMFGAAGNAAIWALTRGGRLDGRAGPGGLVKTTLPTDLGGGADALALSTDGVAYAGGAMQGFSTPPKGFVARYTGIPR